jgi:hypothetical protein
MEVLFGWDREKLEDCGGIFLEGTGRPATIPAQNIFGARPRRPGDGKRKFPFLKGGTAPSCQAGDQLGEPLAHPHPQVFDLAGSQDPVQGGQDFRLEELQFLAKGAGADFHPEFLAAQVH